MNTTEIKQLLLEMQNDCLFQKQSAIYSQKNVFNVLKVERNENRHSAFLCWLFNPQSDHALGVEPIKKLLALYTYHSSGKTDIDSLLLSGNFTIEVEECTTEKLIGEISGSGERDRADVWMRLTVIDNDSNRYLIPLVIENKIYAGEGKEQTNRYHDAVEAFKKSENTNFAIEIFLTPDPSNPSCSEFTNITYQQLLDYVIGPLTSYSMPAEAAGLMNAYIHTLGTPATKSMDEEKDPRKLVNSIMAISKVQQNDIHALYDKYKPLMDAAISVAGGDKAEKILGVLVEDSEAAELLQNFWDCHISLFNTILYVCRTQIASGKEQDLLDVFKRSRRDNSKYIVMWEVNGDGTDWQPVRGYEKPMSKGKAAAVFFMQWMEISSPLSLAEVRAAFPTSINTYYARNKGKKAYDSLIWHSTDNIHAVSESGFTVDIQKDARWDLYPIVRNNPNNGFGLGHAPVLEGTKRNGIAMIAKMWRKADFENLLKHISDHSQDLFARVRIIPC